MKRTVALGCLEAELKQRGREPLEPCARGLFQTVEGAVELADMAGVAGVEEAGWLLAEDRLGEVAVQEGVLDVQLVDRPVGGDGEGEHDTDGGRLDDGRERLAKVDAGLLREAAKNPTCLVPCQRSIRVQFVSEDPFA